jgi:hypothetical protein
MRFKKRSLNIPKLNEPETAMVMYMAARADEELRKQDLKPYFLKYEDELWASLTSGDQAILLDKGPCAYRETSAGRGMPFEELYEMAIEELKVQVKAKSVNSGKIQAVYYEG